MACSCAEPPDLLHALLEQVPPESNGASEGGQGCTCRGLGLDQQRCSQQVSASRKP